jgi:signal transduction histidine kinase
MEVVDLTSENAKESGVQINVSLQEDIRTFKFDARQFKEILINLFQNALKAMKNGGALEVESTMSGYNLIIRVRDNGEGIPEKNLDNIFSPFFSTREGGMGLGLSIVQKIVESHGGRIFCMSEIGKGTTFEITMSLERS